MTIWRLPPWQRWLAAIVALALVPAAVLHHAIEVDEEAPVSFVAADSPGAAIAAIAEEGGRAVGEHAHGDPAEHWLSPGLVTLAAADSPAPLEVAPEATPSSRTTEIPPPVPLSS